MPLKALIISLIPLHDDFFFETNNLKKIDLVWEISEHKLFHNIHVFSNFLVKF